MSRLLAWATTPAYDGGTLVSVLSPQTVNALVNLSAGYEGYVALQ